MQLPFFVYGTLRPGFHNYESMMEGVTTREEDAVLTGAGMFPTALFPFVVDLPTIPNSKVVGTLLWVKADEYDNALERLDFLEGFRGEGNSGNLYDRKIKTVQFGQEEAEAYVYVAAPSFALQVMSETTLRVSGDWAEHDKDFEYFPEGSQLFSKE